MKLRHISPLIAVLLAALMLLPGVGLRQTFAQDGDGRGVVRMADEITLEGEWALIKLMTAQLFDIDPSTGALVGADRSDRALVEVMPPNLPSDEVTFRLRRDARWHDGTPITAYDALFTAMRLPVNVDTMARDSGSSTIGVRLIDEWTIALRFTMTAEELDDIDPTWRWAYEAPTCDDLPRANLWLLPWHIFVPGFREFVDTHAPSSAQPSLKDWWDAYNDADMPAMTDILLAKLTTGSYRPDETYTEAGDRYIPSDGTGAAIEVSDIYPRSSAGALIAGEADVVVNVPVDQRAGLRLLSAPNAGNLQIAEVPGRESLIVLLNFANTGRPLPAFHPETGEPLDQGQHPIFSDPNVRRALQFAIEQNAIIDGVLQRSAVPLAGLYAPASWAFDPLLQPVGTNLEEAKRLLDEAGWIDRGSGRVCEGCATAEEGASLRFTLGSSDEDYEVASALAAQWNALGASVVVTGEDLYGLQSQTFDAYLLRDGGSAYERLDPDRTRMLTPVSDILFDRGGSFELTRNYGSYNNPDVTALIEQANTVPGCDMAARAELYHELERLLQDDLPFLSVIAPTEFYAAAPNVIGFAPRTRDPLWNVEDWVVGES